MNVGSSAITITGKRDDDGRLRFTVDDWTSAQLAADDRLAHHFRKAVRDRLHELRKRNAA